MRNLALALLVAGAGPAAAAEKYWASAKIRYSNPAFGTWFISAPTQELADAIASEGGIMGEKDYSSLPMLQKVDAKRCLWDLNVGPDIRPAVAVGTGKSMKFKGFQAREKAGPRAVPKNGRTYSLSIQMPLPGSEQGASPLNLNVVYSWSDACPDWLKGTLAGIGESLNPGKAAPPSATRLEALATGKGLPGGAAAAAPKKKPTRAATKKATDRLREGMTYLKIGSLYIADQKVTEAVKLDPTAQDVRVAQALVKRLSGDATGAAELIAKIRDSEGDPGASAYRLLKGLKPSDPRLQPPDVPDGLVTGLLKEWDGEKQQALSAYSVAITNDPSSWLAHALRGLLKLELQDCKGSRLDLRAAVRKNSNFTGYAYKGYAELCGAGEAPE